MDGVEALEAAGHREPWRSAAGAQRARAFGEAVLLVVLGFTVDDVRVLRVPGFLVGLGLAFATLTLGPTLHGRRLLGRLVDVTEEDATEALRKARGRGRALAIVATVIFFLWLIAFSQGVPPWAI